MSKFKKTRPPVEQIDTPKAQEILHAADDTPAIINIQSTAQQKKQIATDIDIDLSNKLDQIALHQERSKRYIMRKVMTEYIKEYCEKYGL